MTEWSLVEVGKALLKGWEYQNMNQNIFEGKWNQIPGQSQVGWGKLTDDDFQMDGATQ